MELGEGLKKIGRVARKAAKSLDTRVEVIPLDAIDDKSVAKIIVEQIGNPVLERMGKDRYANPFSIVDVLANMGYVGVWNSDDYMEKFPEQYQAVRKCLHKFSGFGCVEIVPFEESDTHRESIYYKVVDQDKLKDIAEGKEIPQAKSAQ